MHVLPQYTHIVNKRLKHTYLTFDEEGNLIIKSPKVSQHYIENLLLKKSAWINASKKKILGKKGNTLTFSREEDLYTLYFHGREYPLVLKIYTKKRSRLVFDENTFTLYYSIFNETVFHRHIDAFYKEQAKVSIPALLETWSSRMGLSHNSVSFRKTKRQWGSCSGKNDLSFNTMMMKLPPDVIQYIIVHELAHIRHKHHQKDFWMLIEIYIPDYKRQVAELKTYKTH